MCQLSPIALCLHCERQPRSLDPRIGYLRLCDGCGAIKGRCRLYKKQAGWTPAWDAHLQRLVERARLQLPVSVPGPGYDIPRPPDKRAHPRRGVWLRIFRMSPPQ